MNILYLLEGTRRGHAARAIAIGEELIHRQHHITFATDRDAFQLLQQYFGDGALLHQPMPTYAFRRGRIDPLRTLSSNLPFLLQRHRLCRELIENWHTKLPDIIVSDFEPLGWYLSRYWQRPLVAVNSQGFIRHGQLPHMPPHEKCALYGIHLLKKGLTPSSDLELISKPFVKTKANSQVKVFGPCIRKEIRNATWQPNGSALTAYLPHYGKTLLPTLRLLARKLNLTLHLYGAKGQSDDHRTPSVDGFTNHLLQSQLVITTAGSQLLGEIAYLGIPAVCIPEPHQHEQQMNTRLALNYSARFFTCPPECFDPDSIIQHLHRASQHPIIPMEDGSSEIVNRLEDFYRNHRQSNKRMNRQPPFFHDRPAA